MTARNYDLVNAEEMAGRYPKTFHLPEREEIAKLSPGDHAKVIFAPEGDGVAERMWVRIRGRSCERFVGNLDNVPGPDLENVGLHYGAPVRFLAENIVDYVTAGEVADVDEDLTVEAA